MGLLYSAGHEANLLQRAAAKGAVTATNQNSLLPIQYLYDGSGLAFAGSSEVSPFDIVVDLGEVPFNGDMEDVFVSGLPGTGWAKTAGATLTRNTTAPRTGLGCMEASGTSGDYGYFDITVYPGQRLQISAAGRVKTSSGSGSVAKVRVRNLYTGRLLATDGTWDQASGTSIVLTTATTYQAVTVTTQVEGPESGPASMTLRIECYCDNTGLDAALYDDVAVLYAVNGVSVHFHNLVGMDTNYSPELRSSTDGFVGSDTLEKQLTIARPAFHGILSAAVFRRWWKLRCAVDSVLKNGGAPVTIGELWLGYFETAARNQEYGWALSPAFQQVRTTAFGGQEAVYAMGQHDRRKLSLAFKPTSRAQFLELRDRLFRATRGGADPFVIIPADSEDVVIHGRLGPELAHQRPLLSQWTLGMEVLETAPTIIPAA